MKFVPLAMLDKGQFYCILNVPDFSATLFEKLPVAEKKMLGEGEGRKPKCKMKVNGRSTWQVWKLNLTIHF